MNRDGMHAGPSVANIDRRKARIVAALYPTRVKRGFTTERQCKELAARLGVSSSKLYAWENGQYLPHDRELPVIEDWLAEADVYRYVGIERVVGPEPWPTPLHKASTDVQGTG
jgi:transcriptional regulator with XRE-family HTH domain